MKKKWDEQGIRVKGERDEGKVDGRKNGGNDEKMVGERNKG